MSKAYLSLGANLGDPVAQIKAAIAQLNDHAAIAVIAQAPLRRTKPWGKTDQPDFFNTAIEIETGLSPLQLLKVCQSVENALGRQRAERWGPRTIDIDIIAYERIEITEAQLTLPHPHAHERDFVLEPLREIAPQTAEWIKNRPH